MSLFSVDILPIEKLEHHPNADRLDVIFVGGYRCVVKRDIHAIGDKIVYIPTDAIMDYPMAVDLGIADYLVGKNKTRTKAQKLRGVISEGIVLPLQVVIDYLDKKFGAGVVDFTAECNLADLLNIKKYEEETPVTMAGKIRNWPSFLGHYDIENIKRPENQHIFIPLEEVVATDKVHGSNMSVSWSITSPDDVFVCSRNNGLLEDDTNLFWKVAKKYNLIEKLQNLKELIQDELFVTTLADPEYIRQLTIWGELIAGQQDLKYGQSADNPGFYCFDIYLNGNPLSWESLKLVTTQLDIPLVPLVYRGPFIESTLLELTEQNTLLPGETLREGLVIKPIIERTDPILGRVQLKLISGKYLTRRGDATEYH